jgi:transposase
MGEILMSENEVELISLLDRNLEGALKIREVAQRVGLSCKLVIRKKKAYLKMGKAGLVSKKRGNASNPIEMKSKVTRLLKEERYDGFGPTLASETLAEDHGIHVNKETPQLTSILHFQSIFVAN